MGIEELANKFKKMKKGVIEKADKGIQLFKGSPDAQGAKEVGKEVLKEVSGLKTRIIKGSTDFAKTYMKENVTQENSTGATLGALTEYVVKKTVKGVTAVADALTAYIENEADKYHRIGVLPELETAKVLINEYAKDKSEQGEEAINYKGIEIILNKTEKELSVNMKSKQKEIKIKYLLNGNDIEELNKDLGYLTEDLIKRIDKLSDPDTLKINKKTTFAIPRSKGETTYVVTFKKENDKYEVNYAPNNKILGMVDKKHGVIMEYVLQKPLASKEEPTSKEPIPEMLKEE